MLGLELVQRSNCLKAVTGREIDTGDAQPHAHDMLEMFSKMIRVVPHPN